MGTVGEIREEKWNRKKNEAVEGKMYADSEENGKKWKIQQEAQGKLTMQARERQIHGERRNKERGRRGENKMKYGENQRKTGSKGHTGK